MKDGSDFFSQFDGHTAAASHTVRISRTLPIQDQHRKLPQQLGSFTVDLIPGPWACWSEGQQAKIILKSHS